MVTVVRHSDPWEDGVAQEGLQFDPQVIPKLRSAFADALAKVERQIELAGAELSVTAWAGDPISRYAGGRFADQSADSVAALRSYRDALDKMVARLTKAGGDYRDTEEDKNATMNQQG